MLVLTLTQPWATLVAIGAKKIETRSWSTSFRGPLAIHAAKGYGPGGKRGAWWTIQRTPMMYKKELRYNVALHGNDMPLDAQSDPTLAHAIVLAMLTTVEGR